MTSIEKISKRFSLLKFQFFEINQNNSNLAEIHDVITLNLILIDIKKIEDSIDDLIDNLAETKAEEKTLVKYVKEFHDFKKELNLVSYTLHKNLKTFEKESFHKISNSHELNIALPPINLIQFDGDITKFISFWDTFKTNIDQRNDLNDIKKLQYLKASVKGEALDLIRNIPISPENYQEALNLLQNRYNRENEIIFGYIDRILELKTIKSQDTDQLKKLINETRSSLKSLKFLKQPVDHWDSLVIRILMKKLDFSIRKSWIMSLHDYKIPKLEEFLNYLERISNVFSIDSPVKEPLKNKTSKSVGLHATSNETCKLCKTNHLLINCSKFLSLNQADRLRKIKSFRLCILCFSDKHLLPDCKAVKCKKCNGSHHLLLHKEQKSVNSEEANKTPEVKDVSSPATSPSSAPSSSTTPASSTTQSSNSCHIASNVYSCNSFGNIILGTAIINIKSKSGRLMRARALIDSGSQNTLILKSFSKTLGLPMKKTEIYLSGIGNATQQVQSSLEFSYGPRNEQNTSLIAKALIVEKLTNNIPATNVACPNLSHVDNLFLADNEFYKSAPIDIIFGADVYAQIMTGNRIIGPTGSPTAYESEIGWILIGNCDSNSSQNISYSYFISTDDLLHNLWKLDDVPETTRLSEEEKKCEIHFRETHKIKDNGRTILKLPFKEDKSFLPNNFISAKRRFLLLEKKLEKDSNLKNQYHSYMNEYISSNHMELVQELSREEIDSQTSNFYLPHHPVIKEASLSTKVRVVFDGSAQASNGNSLNNCLMTGPSLQPDIRLILTNFRFSPIAIAADIEKMYCQIKISPEDRNFLRCIWRDNPLEPLKIYRLTTLPFGLNCSPYLAIRTIQALADRNINKYPYEAKIIKEQIYVDDLLTGGNNEKEILQTIHNITSILSSGGFKLDKWSSNNKQILEKLSKGGVSTKSQLSLQLTSSTTTLGIVWETCEDLFKIKYNFIPSECITKRIILSELARLYDPLGFLSPLIIKFKIIFQETWLQGLDWDDHLSPDHQKSWKLFRNQIQSLDKIEIPRCIIDLNAETYYLCGFCDASSSAYAATLYLCAVKNNHIIKISLIASKAKVKPSGFITLPRLELCAAVLLAKLISFFKPIFMNFITKIICFSDSNITLSWIKSHPSKWKVFVANRIQQIQDKLPTAKWFHVPSKENPADLATRGISLEELIMSKLWWHGPQFLKNTSLDQFDDCCQIDNHQTLNTPIVSQESNVKNTISLKCNQEENLFSQKYSFKTLNRIAAYILRFKYNSLSKIKQRPRRTGDLSSEEIQEAFLAIWRFSQINYLPESKYVKGKIPFSKKSSIKNLSPYLDDNTNLIRVGGRLELSDLPDFEKHPIILSKNCPLLSKYIYELHLKLCHANFTLLFSHLNQQFWIIGARNLIRKIIHNCIICFRFSSKPLNQSMGSLPVQRITPSRPFTVTGVDYAGPFNIIYERKRGAKSHKAYVCVFICFSTKAIHLEIVTDLSTTSFLQCLSRFISRRGSPKEIHSDHGTNFQGAKRELIEFYKHFQDLERNPEIQRFSTENQIDWKFIPPSAPHHGGLWEAAVKAMKYHLKRVSKNHILTLIEFETLICRIESILNSRPLCRISESANMEYLTPGHFLITTKFTSPPTPDLSDISLNRLTRWQLVEQVIQSFWKKWHNDYLSQLQQKVKWTTQTPNIKVDQIVLLRDVKTSPLLWKLGRIIQIFPGKDGKVRVVKIRTLNGEYTRPITKLAPLPE